MLVALGADVIKIEAPDRPDGLRLAARRRERHPSFDDLNGGKRFVGLNLRHEEARRVLSNLVATADVVVDNYSRRVVRNWGLGWEEVSMWGRGLLWVAMPAYSSSGPYRDYTAHGWALEAISGAALAASTDGTPRLHPFPIVDPLAGLHAAFAVIEGLSEVGRTGRPLRIEVPQSEVALQLCASWLSSTCTERAHEPPQTPADVAPPGRRVAPSVGSHTMEVLHEMGWDVMNLRHLVEAGAIATGKS